MSDARTALKYALPFAGVFLIGVASAAFDPRYADAVPSRCSVDVLIHEDVSYSKGAIRFDGKEIAPAWDIAGPRQQNHIGLRNTPTGGLERVAYTDWDGKPVFRGERCDVVVVNSL